jgi:acetyl-CoA carboxylase biotin carboxylase subunit
MIKAEIEKVCHGIAAAHGTTATVEFHDSYPSLENDDQLYGWIKSAAEESEAAFGDSSLYLEKCVTNARHIEVQLLCDKCGNAVHLFERECSLQRRSQKVLEEAPSCLLTPEVRANMGRDAVTAAKKVGYDSVGTVEFLYDIDTGKYYFMELNARVQVEHPVTEMITGIDIVKMQIAAAAGIELPISQDKIKLNGHAIECRINAEDPERNFAPCAGKIAALHVPGGMGIRFDSAIYEGYSIPPYYDSMIGKMIVHGNTREEAFAKMRSALYELEIEGTTTNIPFQFSLLNNRDVINGDIDINFVDRLIGEK